MFHCVLDLFQRGVGIWIQFIKLIGLFRTKDIKAAVQIKADRKRGNVSAEDHIHQILLTKVVFGTAFMDMVDQLLLAVICDPGLLVKQDDACIVIIIIFRKTHHRLVGI